MFDTSTVTFLNELKANNTKDWFAANKPTYERHVKDAAASFCDDLAPRLAARYQTDVTSKVFRIHRDLRFSKDKTPYKTNVHVSFRDSATGAAWMFGLQPDTLVVGFGLFAFDRNVLPRWRETVAGAAGDELQGALDKAVASGLRLSELDLKRVPAPYDAQHQNADLLKRKGLAVWRDGLAQEIAFGPQAPKHIAETMQVFDPVRNWLRTYLPA
ncbi:DUF2461 domain-containing protein [Aliiroseovarius sp. 2305UL8-7]|uniref:DUF2461 domain-containing protein n=1 Tax=Aliiroseovarius conchicola TaxID=3121637 RepID=UPI003529C9BA